MWWQQRSDDPVPTTSAEAVAIAETGELTEPISITVKNIPGDKYDRIIGYQFDNPELEDWQFNKPVPEYVPANDEIPF